MVYTAAHRWYSVPASALLNNRPKDRGSWHLELAVRFRPSGPSELNAGEDPPDQFRCLFFVPLV